MTITTKEAERFARWCDTDGFTERATALRSLAAERDALQAENARLREALQTARRDALREAALRLEELHKNHKYNPKTGEGSEHDVGYCRALVEGAAWIRALDPAVSQSAVEIRRLAKKELLSEDIIRADRDAWPDYQANDPVRALGKEGDD